MPLIPRLTSLWRNLLHKDRVDQEFSEEIQAYLDMLTEANLRQGLSPQAARRNALLELGGVEQVEERVREIRMGRFIESVWRDVRTGARSLVHSPVFTVVTVLSLAPTAMAGEAKCQSAAAKRGLRSTVRGKNGF